MALPPKPVRGGKKSVSGGKGGVGPHPGSTLRLIGGTWRSRRLRFGETPGLRPTPDRVRETLFNWLAPIIPGVRCLDLFAGTGALGLEALSRGARETCFVEAQAAVAAALRNNLQLLDAANGHVWEGDALAFLRQPCAQPYDVVFLDPPFRQGWLERACPLLEAGNWIAPGGRVYLEYERESPPTALPAHWRTLRSKETGQVSYQLLQSEAQAGRNE